MRALLISTNGEIIQATGTGSTESQLVRVLSKMGEVSLMTPARVKLTEDKNGVIGKFKSINQFKTFSKLPLGLQPDYIRTFRRVTREEHIDFIIYSFSFGSFPLILMKPGSSKLIFLSHIYEYGLFKKVRSKMHSLVFGGACRIREKLICRLSDHIISVSDDDKKNISENYGIPLSKITILQLGKEDFFSKAKVQKEEAREKLNLPLGKGLVLFNGTSHYPNRTAAKRIIENIAPMVAKRNPNVEFVIAGGVASLFQQSNVGNVRVIGFVDDLLMLLDAADLAVIPVEIGEGVRVKMIDYMSRGLPVIATNEAMRGINYTNGVDAILADTDEDFAEKILRLINDPGAIKSIGRSAREYADSNFSPEAARAIMERIMREPSTSSYS